VVASREATAALVAIHGSTPRPSPLHLSVPRVAQVVEFQVVGLVVLVESP
jgi:hypothetical protein